jgi:predicted secreted Zn-dependent protease
MKKRLLIAASVAAFAPLLSAYAQVHMCKDAQGRKVYSDVPCGPDATVVKLVSSGTSLTINPSAEVKTEYYDIRGTTWEELKREIDAKGPEGWWGTAQSSIGYKIGLREDKASGQCIPHSIQATVASKVRLPAWANRFEGNTRLQGYWDNVLRTLDLHERGHVKISFEGAQEIERALKAIAPRADCSELMGEADRTVREIRERVARRQAMYDDATDHGRQQWTPYRD